MRLGAGVLMIALGGGCSAQISAGRGAGSGGDPCASRTVYLNFDGQVLARGPSDATRNQASWMTIDQGTAPPYLDGDAGRDAAIQTIVTGIRTQLAAFPITVATTRPASGDYVMIVFGGRRGAVGSQFGAAVNQLDCGDSRPNDVAWISDGVSPPRRVINTAIGAIGFGLGLTATTDPRDCMCGWDNDCQADSSAACTLGSPIARDPAANQRCPGATSQDESATFRAAFCE